MKAKPGMILGIVADKMMMGGSERGWWEDDDRSCNVKHDSDEVYNSDDLVVVRTSGLLREGDHVSKSCAAPDYFNGYR
jgi:hypothetical protein